MIIKFSDDAIGMIDVPLIIIVNWPLSPSSVSVKDGALGDWSGELINDIFLRIFARGKQRFSFSFLLLRSRFQRAN